MTGRPDRPEAARADGAQSPPDQARPDAARPLPDGSDAGDERRADALRSGLDAYELTDEDLELLEAADEPSGPSAAPPLPVLAVVGRPNVGKSTLVNRIVGRRVAVVQDTPGVTRDRVSYPASWSGRDFTLVDTGGWELDAAGIHASVARQSEAAVRAADAVVLVVDATVGIADADADIVRLLRRSGRPVVLAANKVDSAVRESDAAVLWGLGLGEPHPVSAMHGRGMGTLLDAVLAALPEESAAAGPSPAGGPRRIAILGRPNVGKSSLLNRLAQAERAVGAFGDDGRGVEGDVAAGVQLLEGAQSFIGGGFGVKHGNQDFVHGTASFQGLFAVGKKAGKRPGRAARPRACLPCAACADAPH